MKIIIKKSDGYYENGKKLNVKTDKIKLDYIKSLVIPPAYKNVEIYYEDKKIPKILFKGYDSKNRPQAIYSTKWKDKTRKEKLCALIPFSKNMKKINMSINNNLNNNKFDREKIISMILRIISKCYFRIGNIKYEKLYNSFGISTIHRKHISFKEDRIFFKFKGKKGVINEHNIKDPILSRELRKLSNENPDKHLFCYEEEGKWIHIKHTEINNFLKNFHDVLSSKQYRTYDANIKLINILKTKEIPSTISESKRKKNIKEASISISNDLHNTPAVLKKEYIDINIIDMYINHPVKYKSFFMKNESADELIINYLNKLCS